MKNNKTPVVVVVRCITCGKERTIYSGEIDKDSFPFCDSDGMPMLPKKAKVIRKSDERC